MNLLPLVLLWFHLVSSAEQWRVVHKSGAVEAGWGIPRQEAMADVLSAWAWTTRTAPRRTLPSRLGRERRGDDPGRLAVRVVRRTAGRAPSDLRLVAAPAEMWLEVPEAALPSWPVPRDGRIELPLDPGRPWRLRVAGTGEGSWWVEVRAGQHTALLASTRAPGLSMAVLDHEGKPAKGVSATVQEAAGRGGTVRGWAVLRDVRDEEGRLAAPGLTDDAELSLTVLRVGAPPLLLRGRPSTLPHEVRLAAGAELAGRLLDERGRPVVGAVVAGEYFVSSELPQLGELPAGGTAPRRRLVPPRSRARERSRYPSPAVAHRR